MGPGERLRDEEKCRFPGLGANQAAFGRRPMAAPNRNRMGRDASGSGEDGLREPDASRNGANAPPWLEPCLRRRLRL